MFVHPFVPTLVLFSWAFRGQKLALAWQRTICAAGFTLGYYLRRPLAVLGDRCIRRSRPSGMTMVLLCHPAARQTDERIFRSFQGCILTLQAKYQGGDTHLILVALDHSTRDTEKKNVAWYWGLITLVILQTS
jgi:hypothetical protein